MIVVTAAEQVVIFVVLAFLHVFVSFFLRRGDGSVRRWLEDNLFMSTPCCRSFNGGVATRDVLINPRTRLSARLFLPRTGLVAATTQARESLGVMWYRVLRRVLPSWCCLAAHDWDEEPASAVHPMPDADVLHLAPRPAAAAAASALGRASGGSAEAAARGGRLPVVVFFHGGGFTYCTTAFRAYDFFCRHLALLAGCIVVSAEYRRTPHTRYPAQYLDALEVLEWVGQQTGACGDEKAWRAHGSGRQAEKVWAGADEMGEGITVGEESDGESREVEPWLRLYSDSRRVVVMGDSAGGNIVHNSLLMLLHPSLDLASPVGSSKHQPTPAAVPQGLNGFRAAAAPGEDSSAAGEADGGGVTPPVAVYAGRGQPLTAFGLTILGSVLICPYFGSEQRTESDVQRRHNLTFNLATTDRAWRDFLPPGTSRDHFASNPARLADSSALALFPPTLVVVASEDVLHDHGVAYHRHMRRFNAPCTLMRFESVHDFPVIFPKLRASERCFGAISCFIEALTAV